jgi:hypothetical protein
VRGRPTAASRDTNPSQSRVQQTACLGSPWDAQARGERGQSIRGARRSDCTRAAASSYSRQSGELDTDVGLGAVQRGFVPSWCVPGDPEGTIANPRGESWKKKLWVLQDYSGLTRRGRRPGGGRSAQRRPSQLRSNEQLVSFGPHPMNWAKHWDRA